MRLCRICALSLVAAAVVVAPRAARSDAPASDSGSPAARLATARSRLETALGALDGTPTRERITEIHRAMDEIRGGLRAYFHGRPPTDDAGRAALSGLRAEVMRLLGGPRPIVVVAHDVLRFHPTVHRHVARVCQQVGEFHRAVEHLRAVQAIDGARPDDLAALVAAYRAAGDERGATAAAAELNALGPAATATGVP